MKKADIIQQIKAVIEDYGSFNTAEVNAEQSPCIASLGRTCQLAEAFYKDKVEVVTYTNYRDDVSSDYIPYEKIKVEQLNEILVLAKKYKEQQEEE